MLSSSPEAIPTSFRLHPYREQYSSVEWVLCEHHSRPQETKRNKPGVYALSRTSVEQHAHIKVCVYVCVYIYIYVPQQYVIRMWWSSPHFQQEPFTNCSSTASKPPSSALQPCERQHKQLPTGTGCPCRPHRGRLNLAPRSEAQVELKQKLRLKTLG